MPRKTHDHSLAREAAQDLIARSGTAHLDRSESGGVVQSFPAVEFEVTTSRVGGETVTLRRVVLTGPWEVVTAPSGG